MMQYNKYIYMYIHKYKYMYIYMKQWNETVSVCQYNELLEYSIQAAVLEFYNHLFSPLDDAKLSALSGTR